MKKARSAYYERGNEGTEFLDDLQEQWIFAKQIYCARLTTNFPVTIEMALNEAYDLMASAREYVDATLEEDEEEESA
jgi:hypothetical protein